MVVAFLILGTCFGLIAAGLALLAGAPLWLALLCYSLAGGVGIVLVAVLLHCAAWPRRRVTESGVWPLHWGRPRDRAGH